MIRQQSIPRLLVPFPAAAIAMWLVVASPLAGQDSPPPGQETTEIPASEDSSTDTEPPSDAELDPTAVKLVEKLDDRITAWYDTLGKMRSLQIRFHNGTDATDRKYRREFRELESQSRLEHEAAFQAAIELADYHPQGIPGVWDFIIKSVSLRGEFDWYEGIAPAAQAIQELKRNDPSLDVQFPMLDAYQGRALVTEHEWEQAREALQRAIQVKEPSETDFRLLTQLESLPEQWERERELRQLEAEADDLPRVLLETTRGKVIIELFENEAPNTVANFIELVEQGFYDQLPFYTVVENFFATTGDPIGDGSGDAGYRIPDETDHPDARRAFRGSLFMAKIPDPDGEAGMTLPDTASSQFMILFLPLPVDHGQYTVFGRVIEGMPHVSMMTRVDPTEKTEGTRVLPPDRILSTKMIRKRNHEYNVERIEYRDPLR